MPIVTLIAADRLEDSLVTSALERVGGGEARWLDRGSALDIVTGGGVADLKAALEPMEGLLDVVVRPAREPLRLFVADMDSTMIGQECIDELADYAGFRDEVAAITERAMQGELDFAAALAERVALLEGLKRDVIAQCLAERIRPNPGAPALMTTLRSQGVRTLLVSGGFTDFVRPIAEQLGFDDFRANQLESDGKALTGRTIGPIVDSRVKRLAADELATAIGVGPGAVMAVGDGANDSELVEWAGTGIGYHHKPALARVADGAIRHHDLSALLWVAGIPRKDWVA